MKEEIIDYVFTNTNVASMNAFTQSHNLTALFYKHKNYLLHKYFDGYDLKFSVFVSDLVNEYMPSSNELRCNEIAVMINTLSYDIKLLKRFAKAEPTTIRVLLPIKIKEHNLLVQEYNRLTEGLNLFINQYKKHIKTLERTGGRD